MLRLNLLPALHGKPSPSISGLKRFVTIDLLSIYRRKMAFVLPSRLFEGLWLGYCNCKLSKIHAILLTGFADTTLSRCYRVWGDPVGRAGQHLTSKTEVSRCRLHSKPQELHLSTIAHSVLRLHRLHRSPSRSSQKGTSGERRPGGFYRATILPHRFTVNLPSVIE